MSKIDIVVDDDLDFEVGDCCIVKKPNGTIGKVILTEMDHRTPLTEGYKKMFKIIDIIKPGAKKDFIQYNRKKLH